MAESKTERDERIKAEKEFRVRFLVRETGITEEQARELIDRSALIRLRSSERRASLSGNRSARHRTSVALN